MPRVRAREHSPIVGQSPSCGDEAGELVDGFPTRALMIDKVCPLNAHARRLHPTCAER